MSIISLALYDISLCALFLLFASLNISFKRTTDSKTAWSFSLSPGLVFVLSPISSFLCMLSAIQRVLWC